jgi:hypothetical protein
MSKLIRFDIVPFILKKAIIIYRFSYLPIRIHLIRRKRIIKVAFVISDLGKWKTELLFCKMLENNKFAPVIFVVPYLNHDNSSQSILLEYLNSRQYPYYVFDNKRKFFDIVKPDILFYQEPYNGDIHSIYEYKRNIFSLFCYVSYAFHTIDSQWFLNSSMLNFAWQVYFENSLVVKNLSNVMTNKGVNCLVTGLPFTDIFLQPISAFKDPWIFQKNKKKKIIWAPHHTILNETLICYSTFMKYHDIMLSLAKKYEDIIQIAFKPHPVLRTKLYQVWGKEKTDYYYSLWEKGENTQLVLGDYVPLFMYSDALIHDCGSFTVEYHYTKKPVMYLLKDESHKDSLNEFGRMAFDLHYIGRSVEDIESFIIDVVAGRDELKMARVKFYNDYLCPPYGNSASDNIINAIIG